MLIVMVQRECVENDKIPTPSIDFTAQRTHTYTQTHTRTHTHTSNKKSKLAASKLKNDAVKRQRKRECKGWAVPYPFLNYMHISVVGML